jgi:cytochrome c551
MMARVMRRRPAVAFALLAVTAGIVACGSEGISPSVRTQGADVQHGAQLFAARCSGCHTLDVAGTQGTTKDVRQRERTDGPNFNVRRETPETVLYAIRNGGFSGAIMPENIAVGQDAKDIAAFLSKYAGGERKRSDISPESQPGG